jgi:hypothetical protein
MEVLGSSTEISWVPVNPLIIVLTLTFSAFVRFTDWKHPGDLSRGRVFLRTAPLQHVYLLNYLLTLSLT